MNKYLIFSWCFIKASLPFIIIIILLIGIAIEAQSIQDKQDWETPMIHKAYFEGHSYLIYKRDGICHDENCKCKK